MKKAYSNSRFKKNILGIIVCLFIFNFASCGLDSFYVIEAPKQGRANPMYSSVEEIEKYFEFYTYEAWFDPASEFKFAGTDVYYRIYNNSDTLVSETSRIQTLADSTTSSSSAATTLVDTYKYTKLKLRGHKQSTLIPYTGSDRKVHIRLSDFDENDIARIEIDSVYQGEPLRNSSDELTFKFNKYKENTDRNRKPLEGDSDVKYGRFSQTDPNEWYIAMFALAVGRDSTFTEIQSIPVYLGSICIQEDDN